MVVSELYGPPRPCLCPPPPLRFALQRMQSVLQFLMSWSIATNRRLRPKGRRELMNRMVVRGSEPRLGIEKSPPELGIYLSVIERNVFLPVGGCRQGSGRSR